MVISASPSSSSALPAIKAASEIGAKAVSALQVVVTSAAAGTGFDCMTKSQPNPCRLGDYVAASPGPASPAAGTTGEVWFIDAVRIGRQFDELGLDQRNFRLAAAAHPRRSRTAPAARRTSRTPPSELVAMAAARWAIEE
jgi:hypothetical protein